VRPSLRTFFHLSARAIVLGASLGCLAWLTLLVGGRLHAYTRHGAALIVAIPFMGAIILGYIALRQSDSTVVRVARELAMLVVSLWIVEAAIAIWAPESPRVQVTRIRTAAKLGIPFDPRTKSQVTEQLRTQGVDAYPGISREWPQQASVKQQLPENLFPLSDSSNAWIVECNETGRYLVFKTDEFGFNNPAGLLSSGRVSVAAVGASFTLGHCLPAKDTLIGRLRERYPGIANFGIAGGGALSMLASFREYVEPLRPRLVLWIMHPRTADASDEARDLTLARYLDPSFTQRLFTRREEIDQAWRQLAIPVQYEFDNRSKAVINEALDRRFTRLFLLPQLRSRLQLDEPLRAASAGPSTEAFIHAVQLANATTRGWGGRLVVVIMPLYEEVVARQLPPTLQHQHLARIVSDLGIPVIDTAAVFSKQRDPAHLYTMRINNHPNSEGYRLLADIVIGQLIERDLQPVVSTR
jgi:hypothetical protein